MFLNLYIKKIFHIKGKEKRRKQSYMEKYNDVVTQSISDQEVSFEKEKEYHVIIYNDDITPRQYVDFILKTIFHKTPEEAEVLIEFIEAAGQSIVGKYTKEDAVIKVLGISTYNVMTGNQLKSSIEEA